MTMHRIAASLLVFASGWILLTTTSCQSRDRAQSTTTGDEVVAAAPYAKTLPTLAAYKELSGHPHELVRDVVKFTTSFNDLDASVVLQNTRQFAFHLDFLNRHYPPFDTSPLDSASYTLAIYGAPPDFSGKRLSAGMLIWSDTWPLSPSVGPGTMVFSLYFGGVGAVVDQALLLQMLPEVKSVFLRLQAALPFAVERLAFTLPPAFRFGSPTVRNAYKEAGIPVIFEMQSYRDEFLATAEAPPPPPPDAEDPLAAEPALVCNNALGMPDEAARKRSVIKAGQVILAVDICPIELVFGTPGTGQRRARRLALVDASQHVDSSRRGQRQVIDADAPATGYSAVLGITHHNGCDSLEITTPDGNYLFQNGAVDPGTLTQDNCGSHAGKLLWTVDYAAGEKVTGLLESCASIYKPLCE